MEDAGRGPGQGAGAQAAQGLFVDGGGIYEVDPQARGRSAGAAQVVRAARARRHGSDLDMMAAVRSAGLDLAEAARLASAAPAAFLGLADSHGAIAAGRKACLVVADRALEIVETWIDGVRDPAAR